MLELLILEDDRTRLSSTGRSGSNWAILEAAPASAKGMKSSSSVNEAVAEKGRDCYGTMSPVVHLQVRGRPEQTVMIISLMVPESTMLPVKLKKTSLYSLSWSSS